MACLTCTDRHCMRQYTDDELISQSRPGPGYDAGLAGPLKSDLNILDMLCPKSKAGIGLDLARI